mmetsp:Transcript_72517/g.198695  ORF Transcript_72517/g.198695 Transcript_72517/m.198695 type:complete len:216 (+) Transcript_72517:3-650(+)
MRNFSARLRQCVDDGVSIPAEQGLIGPLRPNTTFTTAWRDRVHQKLDAKVSILKRRPGGVCSGIQCDYALGWQAILGNVWRELEAEPGLKKGKTCLDVCGYGCPLACYRQQTPKCHGSDVAQGNNAGVSSGFKQITEEDFTLRSPGVMGQMVRYALGIEPNAVVKQAMESQGSYCLTLEEERLYRNTSAAAQGQPTCPPIAHPGYATSERWFVRP